MRKGYFSEAGRLGISKLVAFRSRSGARCRISRPSGVARFSNCGNKCPRCDSRCRASLTPRRQPPPGSLVGARQRRTNVVSARRSWRSCGKKRRAEIRWPAGPGGQRVGQGQRKPEPKMRMLLKGEESRWARRCVGVAAPVEMKTMLSLFAWQPGPRRLHGRSSGGPGQDQRAHEWTR